MYVIFPIPTFSIYRNKTYTKKFGQITKKDPHLILKPIKPNVTPFHMLLV